MAFEIFRVLIVDDDPLILEVYADHLRQAHYEVLTAQNGEEGLKLAWEEQPDAILLDIMMPGMDGNEVCRRLRAAPSTAAVPVLMLTALSGQAARAKAREVGADDYITKGEDPAMLDGRIKSLLKRRMIRSGQSWLAELPGTPLADRMVRTYLERGGGMAFCRLDLARFRKYNLTRGFEFGDRVLWRLARVLKEVVEEAKEGDFVAHLGEDDFLLLTSSDRAGKLIDQIIERFSAFVREEGGGAPPEQVGLELKVAIIDVPEGGTTHPGMLYAAAKALLQKANQTAGHRVERTQV